MEVLTLCPRLLRVLVGLAVLECTACFGVPIPELASFPIRSDSQCRTDVLEAFRTMDGVVDVIAAGETKSSVRLKTEIDTGRWKGAVDVMHRRLP